MGCLFNVRKELRQSKREA